MFKTGFESNVTLNTPTNCGSVECYQTISGTDSSTGFAFPAKIWGSDTTIRGGTYFQMMAQTAVTSTSIYNYVDNELQFVTGHSGTATTALFEEVKGSYETSADQQDPFEITPNTSTAQGDLYLREWIKTQGNLNGQMVPGQTPSGQWGDWRVVAEWKTGGTIGGSTGCVPGAPAYGGDYRVIVYIMMDSSGNFFWRMQGDNNANGGLAQQVFWKIDNHTVPVQPGQWFKFEWFWHRSGGSDGRVWAAINGQVIADHLGPNLGQYSCKINRIVPSTIYSGGYLPAYQWVDELEIWSGFPSDASPH